MTNYKLYKSAILNRSRLVAILLISIMIFLPQLSGAALFLNEDDEVISSNDLIEDDVYIFGNNAEVYGDVIGDYTGFVFRSNLSGNVDGNLNLFSNRCDIEGEITKSARIFSQDLDISGKVNQDVTAFANTLTISRRAEIGRDLTVFGSVVYVDGSVAGTARIWAGSVIVSGKISEDLIIEADEITIEKSAVIEGNFDYTSKDEALVEDGALIGGSIKHKEPDIDKKLGDLLSSLKAIAKLIFFILTLVTGLVIIALFRSHARESGHYIQGKIGYAIGIGFIALMIFTAGALLLGIMGVGIPLAIILTLVGIIFFYIGKIYCAIAIGMTIFSLFGQKNIGPAWSFVVGLIVLSLLFAIPTAGWIIYLLAFIIGTGGAIGGYLTICKRCKELSSANSETQPQ